MHQYARYVVVLGLFFLSTLACSTTSDTTEHRRWVLDMKKDPKGPFVNVYWYCNDGEVLAPKPYACRGHGGGKQHGELKKEVVVLQSKGYWIANLLTGIDAKNSLLRNDFDEWYHQLLIEKFLINTDNGWILEKAKFYRGAIQEEDERAGARKLLIAMVAKPEWIGLRFSALRTGFQLLPHGQDSASIQKVRQMSNSLAALDEGFLDLRTKIHVSPDARDAERVTNYAATITDPQLHSDYLTLADEINRVFQQPPLPELLERTAKIFSGARWLQKLLQESSRAYGAIDSIENRYATTSALLADLREALPNIKHSSARLRVIDLSLVVEIENFKASTELRSTLADASRKELVFWLGNAALAAYGTGHINRRGLNQIQTSLSQLTHERVPLGIYLKEIKYLARVPSWGQQGLRFHFSRSMEKLADIEPKALMFIQDILRAGSLFFYSQTLDSLSRDGHQLAEVNHMVFGQQVGVGLHALNPGIVRGFLHTKPDIHNNLNFDPTGIYLLPETIANLPPVAGIITAGEGNALSHVQLLARNLGIPNVSVSERLLEELQGHDGEMIVLAVSQNGLVELSSDTEQWRKFFETKVNKKNVVIRPNLERLDLTVKDFIALGSLRATDSGRIVGPKAAKLGELKYHYPKKVAKGITIPFGVFREVVLDQAYKHTTKTVFEWMESQYKVIANLPKGSNKRKHRAETFRAELYDIIINTDLGGDYRKKLYQSMIKTFGTSDVGAFIRSDTNVEDLPGFTGAGLNLTLFNVVGLDNIFEGISRVWASPFTARAFSWRQALMEKPQHVYPAILIMQTVANDKSGVMVTQDIDTGEMNTLSVAVNEGVGGAVDGQSAESLRIDVNSGQVRLLASATAPFRKVPLLKGGIDKLPVSGSDRVLKVNEIKQLIQLAKELPETFPAIVDDIGVVVPADIEFGFYKGELQLFQLRPFLQNKQALSSSYLLGMDKGLRRNTKRFVKMEDQLKNNELPD